MPDLVPDLARLLPAILDWASRQTQVGRLWLYGSRARGDHRVDSDLDVAVAVRAPLGTDDEKQRFWAMLESGSAELSAACNLSVSVQAVATPGDDRGVERDGVLVYEAAL